MKKRWEFGVKWVFGWGESEEMRVVEIKRIEVGGGVLTESDIRELILMERFEGEHGHFWVAVRHKALHQWQVQQSSILPKIIEILLLFFSFFFF